MKIVLIFFLASFAFAEIPHEVKLDIFDNNYLKIERAVNRWSYGNINSFTVTLHCLDIVRLNDELKELHNKVWSYQVKYFYEKDFVKAVFLYFSVFEYNISQAFYACISNDSSEWNSMALGNQNELLKAADIQLGYFSDIQ